MSVRLRALAVAIACLLAGGLTSAAERQDGGDRPVAVSTGAGGDTSASVGRFEPGSTSVPDEVPPTVPSPTTTVPGRLETRPTTPSTKPGEDPNCVPGTHNPRNGECEMRPRFLVGRVTDVAGGPIAGVCMYWLAAVNPAAQVARTGADGRYSATGNLVSGGMPYLFTLCPDVRPELGFAPVTITSPRLMPGDTATVDLTLTQVGGLRGRVVDSAGAPLPGMCVIMPGTPDNVLSTATDELGRFTVAGSPAGQWHVHVTSGQPCSDRAMVPHGPPEVDQVVTISAGGWTETTVVVRFRNLMTGELH